MPKGDTQGEKIQTPVRIYLAFVSGGVFNCFIRTTVRILPQGTTAVKIKVKL